MQGGDWEASVVSSSRVQEQAQERELAPFASPKRTTEVLPEESKSCSEVIDGEEDKTLYHEIL